MEIITTAFGNGSTHDFRLFTENYTGMVQHIQNLADTGYLGLIKLRANSRIPAKQSERHPMTAVQKSGNRDLADQRIFCEHVIGKLKVFHILSDRYRNRRKRFKLRFNLIAAIYNFELQARL